KEEAEQGVTPRSVTVTCDSQHQACLFWLGPSRDERGRRQRGGRNGSLLSVKLNDRIIQL
ncbi:hypothetical protein Pmar_PMAR014561, partial [Perkinsus marinus ATCC 50983]